MSPTGSEQSSIRSEGSGLTFVRPLPRAQGPQNPDSNDSADIPRSRLELSDRLFPPRHGDEADSFPSVTGMELGHFVVEERIGRGGMGAVFRAIDKRLDRVVALKVLSPELSSDPEAVQRFQNEARAAARLDHDNIARVHYIGEERGMHFIAFEFVTGTNVREFILQKGKLTPESAVNYTLQIVEALRHTAAANVVHRDIKPSNIIVSPTGRAKLVDLGLARHDQSHELTVAGTALGTFDYISPEQAIDARNVDVRSDIYSLGCTIYHMLTGEPPYPSGTMFQKVINHHNPVPPEARLKNPRVSVQLSRVIQKMMASNPDERYASPETLKHDLQQIADSMGLAPTNPEAVVWETPLFQGANPYWDGTRTWMAVAIVLLILVFLVDRNLQTPSAAVDQLTVDELIEVLNRKLSPAQEGLPPVGDGVAPSSQATDEAALTESSPITSPSSPTSPTGSERPVATQVEPAPTLSQLESTNSFGTFGAGFSGDLLPANGEIWDLLRQPVASSTSDNGSVAMSATTETASPIDVPAREGAGSPAVTPDATSPADDRVFFVLQPRTGDPVRVATLAEAFALAADNSAIEVDSPTGLVIQKQAIQYSGKRVILRAAGDSHPTIRFDLSEELMLRPLATSAAIFDIGHGGALDLYNVDLELVVDSQTPVDEWAIVRIAPSVDVFAQWSSFTLNNPENRSASFAYIPKSKPSDISNLMPERMSGRPSTVVLRDSICRGQMDGVKQQDLHPLDVRFEQTAFAISGAVHRLDGSAAMDTNMVTDPEPTTSLVLNHVTAIVGEGLLAAMTGEHGTFETVLVEIRESVFRIEGDAPAVISVSGNAGSDQLLDRVQFQSLSERSFVQTSGPLLTVESTADFDFEPRVVKQRELETLLVRVVDQKLLNPAVTLVPSSWHLIQPDDFNLYQPIEGTANPALKAASDGRNAGVDWSRSGLPESLPQPANDATAGTSLIP